MGRREIGGTKGTVVKGIRYYTDDLDALSKCCTSTGLNSSVILRHCLHALVEMLHRDGQIVLPLVMIDLDLFESSIMSKAFSNWNAMDELSIDSVKIFNERRDTVNIGAVYDANEWDCLIAFSRQVGSEHLPFLRFALHAFIEMWKRDKKVSLPFIAIGKKLAVETGLIKKI
jgi:hypothetical protein